ncbi:MAG: UMP kinase [Marinilabiliales bacterium]
MKNFKRILLKLSGESLLGNQNYGIDPNKLSDYAKDLKQIADLNIQTGIVIGGGNIFRGLSGVDKGFDRVQGDKMGMMATVINSLALKSALDNEGLKSVVLTSIRMEPIGEYYSQEKAINFLENKYIVIIAGGTGNPFFTTDTASALRAAEIQADVLLKGTRVDGVYDKDPEKFKDAKKYKTISFDEAYKKNLQVMDLTALTLCKENKIPVLVFNMDIPGNLKKIILNENIGTFIHY